MQRLDSDVADADARLHAEFYECQQDGQWKGKPFVRIMVPGDKTNVIDQPAREDHKRRFPRQWLYFQMKNSENQIIGIPLSLWRQERPEAVNDGQLAELTILKFQSVEQLATASDAQIMRLGMGGASLREKARQYLASKNAQTNGAELDKAKDEIQMLKAAVDRMQAAMTAQTQPAAEKTYRAGAARRSGKRRGRPVKLKVTDNGEQHSAPADAASL